MNNINKEGCNTCYGCGGCVAICPKEAIEFKLGEDGYFIAKANDKCINCGKCTTVCLKYIKLTGENFSFPISVYSGHNKNINIAYPSSSGGIASAVAAAGLKEGYTVCGAFFDVKSVMVEHIFIDKAEDLPLIRGSKYVQSDTSKAFIKIKDMEKVFFIGTPCQNYALRKLYPDKDILFVDFRCGGIQGYKLLNKYFDYLNTVNKSGVKSFNFRAKNQSWLMFGFEAIFNDGTKYYKNKNNDLFGKCMSVHNDSAHSVCRKCGFLNSSVADLRVEDCWQMHNITKYRFKNGHSQIGVFTEKGKELFIKSENDLCVEEIENNYHKQSALINKYSNEGKLYNLVYNTNLPLEQAVKTFEVELSFKKKIKVLLIYLVSSSYPLHHFSHFIYKKILKK